MILIDENFPSVSLFIGRFYRSTISIDSLVHNIICKRIERCAAPEAKTSPTGSIFCYRVQFKTIRREELKVKRKSERRETWSIGSGGIIQIARLTRNHPTPFAPPLFHHIYCIYVHYTIYIHSRKEKRYLFSTNRWADGKKAFPRSEIEYISVHVHIDKKRERKSKKKTQKKMEYNFPFKCIFFPRVYLGRRTIWCNLIYACDQLESSCIWILKGIII